MQVDKQIHGGIVLKSATSRKIILLPHLNRGGELAIERLIIEATSVTAYYKQCIHHIFTPLPNSHSRIDAQRQVSH